MVSVVDDGRWCRWWTMIGGVGGGRWSVVSVVDDGRQAGGFSLPASPSVLPVGKSPNFPVGQSLFRLTLRATN